VTPELKAEMAAFAKAHPELSQTAIASRFNVNPGRVSEALQGKRPRTEASLASRATEARRKRQ
jgi:hypothetical protein